MADRASRRGWADLVLAAGVVAVVVMLIVPLPRLVIDLGLVASLGLAVVLVMAAVVVRDVLRVSTFPTVILLTTLVRLGLGVAVTRLILADADAGEVVYAFGALVAGDHIVVGLVVFAVITIIELVVVTRGAERVAEVAARFALDALPGKQMAIDADLRAGAIDASEARHRRRTLERESQLFGAMDGAMKFIKGEAVAMILIVVVNLGGGLAIGLDRGLGAGTALHTYALLAVGAGLILQISALVVATAAGLLVTRVAGDDGSGALGDDIATQVLGEPRATATAGVLLVVLALLPGLPALPFLLLAVACGAATVALRARQVAPLAPLADVLAADDGVATRDAPARLIVEVGPELAARLRPSDEAARLTAALAAARHDLADRLGVRLPGVVARTGTAAAARLAARECCLLVDGVAVDWWTAADGGAADEVAAGTARALARIAHELVTVDAVQVLLDEVAATQPALVREVVPRTISLPVLTEVVRLLVREGVPVRAPAALLEALLALPPDGTTPAAPTVRDAPTIAEAVRGKLRRHISERWAPRGQLAAWTLDGMIEDAVRGSVERRDGGTVLALEPELARDIVAAVRRSVAAAGDGPTVLLTSGDVRRHLRGLLEPELPEVTVLAPHELAPGVTVRAAGRVEVS